MKKTFAFRIHILLLAAIGFLLGSCGKDDVDNGRSGISARQWDAVEYASAEAARMQFDFTALGAWSASSSADWCTVNAPSSGPAGEAVLELSVGANATGKERTAEITVSVSGYAPERLSVKQSAVSDSYELNRWMLDYMKTHYLWNEAVPDEPDYTLGYTEFLDRVLNEVAAQNDINHDDGHWENGRRLYFYSNIQRYPLQARGIRQQAEGFGIDYMAYGNLLNQSGRPSGRYFFLLMEIASGSPADKAGLKRGDCIMRINGTYITDYEAGWDLLVSPETGVSVTVDVASQETPNSTKPVTLTATFYDDDPVHEPVMLTAANGDKTGYLYYSAFNYYYDDRLIEAIGRLRNQGAKHLILDLRYNGGGHTVSSAVLGTLIAGNSRKDRIYCKETYNRARTQAGEKESLYKIGNPKIESSTGSDYYAPIGTALSQSLELGTVYLLCTANTASASEAVVNGLRGLGIDVRLIGERTNGKNVGMEPLTRNIGAYEYVFNPITFYVANEKNESDYSDGFAPDVAIDEFAYETYDNGDPRDPLTAAALSWIATGTKPASDLKTRTDSRQLRPLPRPHKKLDGMISLPFPAEQTATAGE